MKRIFAFLVAIVMLAGVCPAMGESLKSEKEDVVIHVRKTLGIDDNFDDFTGDKFSGLWHLDWTSEEGNVSVTCSPEGKIFSYYSYENNEPEPAPYDYAFKPSFPGAGDESIMKAADEFMTLVLDENEGWTFTEVQGGGLDRGDGESMLNGRLMLEGMLTDITIDLSVDTDTLAVTSFYRSDNYNVYRNDVVDAAVNVGADEAKAAIMDKFDMEIRYYVSDYSDMARLVYMPRTDNRFIVRASDGELINLEDAYDILWGSVTEEDAAVEYVLGAENPKELVELSDAEKAAACAYEGAMDIASLDKLARSMTELAIDEGFMLTAASYYFTDTCLVASLEYNHKLTEEELAQRLDISVEKAAEMIGQGSNRYDQKMIELNAHDGTLESFNFWRAGHSLNVNEVSPAGTNRDVAEEFIKKYMGDLWENIALRESSSDGGYGYSTEYYQFARMHGGYPFPENYVNITVNSEKGTIERVTKYWNDGQEFYEYDDAPISPDEALEAFTAAQEFECAFVTLPVEMDEDYNTVHERVLAWQFYDPIFVYAVDAMTGKPMAFNAGAAEAVEYSDIEGIPQQDKIAAIGKYGIGWTGGEFCPNKEFTVADMLTMLLCMDGQAGAEEWNFYDAAMHVMYLGAGDYSAADPEAAVTKNGLAKALVTMCGYGEGAAIGGIYALDYADADDVLDEDVGFIAIAAGLGFIHADAEGSINAYDVLTRAEAAEIIYDFLAADK